MPSHAPADILRVLRIKGHATAPDVAVALGGDERAVRVLLRRLAREELVGERLVGARRGWSLTSAGRERDAAPEHRLDDGRLHEAYAAFLAVNEPVKAACAAWLDELGEHHRHRLLGELRRLHRAADEALADAADAVPRFASYRARLARALDRAAADPCAIAGAGAESFHGVWFECHEDLLLTLGRTRAGERAW